MVVRRHTIGLRSLALVAVAASGLAGALVAALATGPAAASAQVAPPRAPSSIFNNDVYGVDALSATDAWIVGTVHNRHGDKALTEHWDGQQWTKVANPKPARRTAGVLYGVDSQAASDAWAVGTSYRDGTTSTLIEHWDGATWSLIPDDVPKCCGSLSAVSVGSTSDVWAVGKTAGRSTYTPLVEHWDGTAWTAVSTPDVGRHAYLVGVSALSSDEAWAVGEYDDVKPLIEHWDGATWSTLRIPRLKCNGALLGVSAVSPSDAWAVGECQDGLIGRDTTLIEHWNGARWTRVPSPNVAGQWNMLYGVAGTSTSDAWAVGEAGEGDDGRSLIVHWDGTRWSVVSSARPDDDRLTAVSAFAADEAWAAGRHDYQSSHRSIALHWDGAKWTRAKT